MADNRSALCIFRVNDIEAQFVRAIAACYESSDGAGTTGYTTRSNCAVSLNPTSAMEFAEKHKCKAASYALPSGRLEDSIISTAIIEWPSTLVSSIITTIEEEHTIVFFGTSAGQLMKYHLRGEGTSMMYETLHLGSPVLLDDHLQITEYGQQHLTVLTEQKIFKLRVENCGYYTTCEDCIGVTNEDGDPNCGWCSLSRTCTRKSACDMPDVSTRWLPYNEAQCLGISSVAPYDSQPHTVQQAITVTVEQLPDLSTNKDYECVFEYGDTSYSSSFVATKSGNDLTCMTPPTGGLPEIPDGKDHITMLLSIRSTETTVKFADTNHTFFECATHERCLDCARSVWDCVWCVYGNKCTHDKNSCTDDTDSTLIAEMEHHDPHTSRQGELECAQLKMLTEEVLVAIGPEREIDITVANLPDTTRVPVDSYLCVLNIEGIDVEVPAVRNGDIVRCEQTNHNFTANIQELNATLTLIWMWGGTPRTIDDEFGFQVILFKCKVDRPDCSRCVSGITTREELLCGWCSSSQLCAVEDDPNCAGPWLRESGNQNCPIPVITSMWPPSGPIEGNTLIEINGTDLGRGFSTIRSVIVAGQPCMFMDKNDTYEMSERLFFITLSSAAKMGDVLITVNGLDGTDQTNMAGTSFAYKDPQIQEFSPVFGPEAGGTKVKIRGTSLVAGRYMEILIGGANCSLESAADDDTEVTCSTGSAMSGDKGPVIMTYDGAERTSQDQDEYEYKDNPNIYRVQPNEAFKAGGRVLRVTGINVDVVQKPEVRISIGGKTYTETCKLTNDKATQMECPSPEVDLPARKRRQTDDGVIATLGFNMDGVTGLRTWSEDPTNNFTFEYFEDPNYFPFYQMVYVDSDSQDILIDGERLNLASTESDVQVLVGNYTCEVVSLGTDVLTCTVILPTGLIDTCVSSNVMVNATIMHVNLEFASIGQVDIICADTTPTVYPNIRDEWLAWLPIIVTLVILIALFLVAIILIYIWFRRRRQNLIAETKVMLIERLRRLHQESEKGLKEAVNAGKTVKLSENVTVDLNDMQIQYSQLTFKNPLGKGEFGQVFLATLAVSNSVRNVAVKTVKGDTGASFTLKFLEEAMIMKNFDHPNVLGLLGLTFDPNGSPLVVLPYMKNGDLRSFLLKDKGFHKISVNQMVIFAHDAAKGMTYLSEQKFVHRDLAARNCMIDEQLSLRIADFGLSRDMNESDYYQSGDRKAKLPVKWMAPESLARRLYSVKSDVWSFAIMLWEMFSRGMKPYQGVPNRDVYHYIRGGNRLSSPAECPSEIYEIMEQCWQHDAKDRPSFREIAEAIQPIQESSPRFSSIPLPAATGNDNGDNDPSYNITIIDDQCKRALPERKSSTDYVVQALRSDDFNGYEIPLTTLSQSQSDYEVHENPFSASETK